MNANIPTTLSSHDSFDELKYSKYFTHYSTWISHEDKLVIDLFITDTDTYGELMVRYNDVVIAVYHVNAQECDDYITSLEESVTLKGSPRYNELRGL